MATKGSYLYYSDAPSGVGYSSMTEYTDGSKYNLAVLNENVTGYQDLDNVLTLELNFWILDDNTSYEYFTGPVGFVTAEKYTCESRYKPTEFIDSDSAVILTDEDGVSLADELEQLLADSDAVAGDVGFTAAITTSDLSGLTITWAGDSTPSVVTITYYDSSGDTIASETFEDSSSNYYELEGESVASIEIMANSLTLPYRMLKINSVGFGREVTLTGKTMRSAKIVNECSLNSETLPASSLTFTFESEDGSMPFEYGAGIKAYAKLYSVKDTQFIGTYYIDAITRKSFSRYEIYALNAVGMLDDVYIDPSLGSGAFVLESTSLNNVWDTLTPYIFTSGSRSSKYWNGIRVAGWGKGDFIGYAGGEDNARDLLQWLCFAAGDGTIVTPDFQEDYDTIIYCGSSGTPQVIDDSRVYQGNTLEEEAVADSAVLVETNFALSGYWSVAEILDVDSSRTYDDIVTDFTFETGETTGESGGKNIKVTDSRFTNLLSIATSSTSTTTFNPAYTGYDIFEFYQRTKTAKCKIVWDGERLGDLVTVPDPYGGTLTGNIQKMTFTLSNITAAEIEVLALAGY